ncbi:MAG: hypothetical protein NHF90_00685 [Candidatus Shikimatogenerans sp. JK-2022]|nr:hypothetical protein [Candidatus Shikimatogenerans bostrichidophilus]
MFNKCFFCHKKKYIITYKKLNICKDCIKKINNKFTSIIKYKTQKIITPRYIKKELDKYIIGQNRSKKIISVTIYNHYKKIIYNEYKNDNNINIEKSNILIIGKTGL